MEVVPEAVPMTTDEEPKSSAEPTPKKVKKAKQNKIKIEEVEAEVIVEEQPQLEVVEAVLHEEKKAKKTKPSKSKSKLDEFGQGHVDLYSLVMKSSLDDLEIQRVIDLLLTKQTGSNGSQHDWVEASGAEKNETKNLQRQLNEKDVLLADEMAKVKSILEKMNALR